MKPKMAAEYSQNYAWKERMHMRTDTKVGRFQAALEHGWRITPLMAWRLWKMQANTFHRSINLMRNRKANPVPVQTVVVRSPATGNRYTTAFLTT